MKKVLIITYYWPPSGGGGVQRWLKFSKYLPENGWTPIIVTPENPDFDIKDPSLSAEIPLECEELRLPIWEPYSAYKKVSGERKVKQGVAAKNTWKQKVFNWIRGNFFIPDPKVFWVRPTSKFLISYLKDRPVDLIVTTGPPHSMHLIGLRLKKKLGVKWLADFRDPWSDWDMLDTFYLSKFARWRHLKLEKKVLKSADQVLTVSNAWANQFESKVSRDVHVITNGYDQNDFKTFTKKKEKDDFVIGHFGLLNSFRNPEVLWAALQHLSSDERRFKLNLYGSLSVQVEEAIHSKPTLKSRVTIKETVPHEEVLKAYGQCSLLLLILNKSKNASGHLPGKLFEYLNTGVPILAIGPHGSDAERILEETGAGKLFDWTEQLEITEFIQQAMDGNLSYVPEAEAIKRFSRQYLTTQLANLLNRMS